MLNIRRVNTPTCNIHATPNPYCKKKKKKCSGVYSFSQYLFLKVISFILQVWKIYFIVNFKILNCLDKQHKIILLYYFNLKLQTETNNWTLY